MKIKKFLFTISISVSVFLLISYFLVEKELGQVPANYNLKGEVTRYGDKIELLLMLIVNLGLNLFLFYLSTKPHILNYPIEVTEQNRNDVYRKMALFLAIFSVFLVSIFGYIFLTSTGIIKEVSNFILITTVVSTILFPLLLFISLKQNAK